MICLSCGRPIHTTVEAVCSEECRQEGIRTFENVINLAPVCSKNRSRVNPGKLREDLADSFSALVEKLKNAPLQTGI